MSTFTSASNYDFEQVKPVTKKKVTSKKIKAKSKTTSQKTKSCSYNGNDLNVGKRGGCYYYSGSGNKVYVDRSYCKNCLGTQQSAVQGHFLEKKFSCNCFSWF